MNCFLQVLFSVCIFSFLLSDYPKEISDYSSIVFTFQLPFPSLPSEILQQLVGHSCHTKQTSLLLFRSYYYEDKVAWNLQQTETIYETLHVSAKGQKIPPVWWSLLKRAHPNSQDSMNMCLQKTVKK